MYTSFITAAEGNRDSYEFALALSEVNILKKHITDFYTPNYIKKYFYNFDNNLLFKKFLTRDNRLLSSENVYISKKALFYTNYKYW